VFALAVVAGLLIALSLPPFGWWPLGALGLAGFSGLLAATAGRGGVPVSRLRAARSRATIGAGVGAGLYSVSLWWATGFNAPGYVALVGHGTLCTAAAGAMVPARRRWGIIAGLPAALMVTDWFRERFPAGGLPIGGLALGQAGGPLAPTARVGGALLVTAMTALAGVAIAELMAGMARRPNRPRVVRGLVALALVVAVVAAGRLGPDGAGSGPHPEVRIALVQGGGQRGLRSVDVDPSLVFQRQVAATEDIDQPVDLVLWPEDVVHINNPVDQTPEGAELSALAVQLHTTLVAGVVTDIGTDRFTNTAVAWSPNGTIVASYDKVHRVPFGEYIPARSLIQHVADLSLVPRDAIAGRGPGILDTPTGPFGVTISYEVFFEDRGRDAIKAGGEVLLVPTNASSYATSQIPTQEIAAAQLRAWETGRYVVQASPTGYSAMITPDGEVTGRSVLGRRQVIVTVVERRHGLTLFVQLGDLPFMVVGLVILLGTRVQRPRRSGGDRGRRPAATDT
jgi:apolipoprotein N-acyltransferase